MVSWRGGRAGQVCYLSEKRGATGPAAASETSADCGRPHASRGAALLERGGPLRGRGRCWGDRDGRYGSISVCPAVRRGVGLRGGAARQDLNAICHRYTSKRQTTEPFWKQALRFSTEESTIGSGVPYMVRLRPPTIPMQKEL